MSISIEPIGFVEAIRPHAEDDYWGGEESCIALAPQFTVESLQGLDAFSHIEVLFFFHEVDPAKIVTAARHPRNNPAWPAACGKSGVGCVASATGSNARRSARFDAGPLTSAATKQATRWRRNPWGDVCQLLKARPVCRRAARGTSATGC